LVGGCDSWCGGWDIEYKGELLVVGEMKKKSNPVVSAYKKSKRLQIGAF
jgi:hypothetical protein